MVGGFGSCAHYFIMMPLKKRPYRGVEYSVAKRLKRVERLAQSNRPELKSITFVATGSIISNAVVNVTPTNIQEGSGGNERIGDHIYVERIEVRGYCDPDMDMHVIKCKSNTEPGIANFTSTIGTFLLDAENDTRFHEILHFRNRYLIGGTNTSVAFKRKLGFRAGYNGAAATTCVSNKVTVSVVNRDVATKSYNFTVRLWYRDG